MLPPFFFADGRPRKMERFFRTRPRLVSLDFDGTLAPIAATPEAARMPGILRESLKRLVRLDSTRVAVLSGRSLQDLERKVRIPGILLVGNHGLTFSDPAFGWSPKALRQWSATARRARDLLQPLVKDWPGAALELKGPDLSLHYRQAHPSLTMQRIPRAIRILGKLPLDHRHGKCVLEFRPRGTPHKGDALERLASRLLRGGTRRGICVHVGDDATDEDAFLALRRMERPVLGLKVGLEPSQAHHRLRNTHEVLQLLNLFKDEEGG